MKRKTMLLALAAIALACLASCSNLQIKREVSFRIPQHPWERCSGRRLWYTFRWTDGENLNTMHLTGQERSVTVRVPAGRTVFAVAYPLGDMSPFGAVVTPEDGLSEYTMSQADGFLANLLIDLDPQVLGMLNYGLIYSQIAEKVDDIRRIEDISLLRDIQNGELSASSFKLAPCHEIGPIALSNGIWESEFLCDPGIVVTDGMAERLSLPSGVFRFLDVESGMVLVLIVDRSGEFYSYLKRFAD